MESLLFLAHRLPFPPNKGDKVRSYHFFKHLAGRYRVFLGTFVDDPADWEHVESVRGLCAGMHVEALAPWTKRARSAAGLLTGEALTLPYFRSATPAPMGEGSRRGASASRARSRSPRRWRSTRSTFRKCGASSISSTWTPRSGASMRAGARGRFRPSTSGRPRGSSRYERDIAARAEASIFVTREEAELFCAAAPECAQRVVAIRNGVDSEYFSPAHDFASPFAPGERPIVFTGAMDYWPNVDAVSWFAREVLPRDPQARCVGALLRRRHESRCGGAGAGERRRPSS